MTFSRIDRGTFSQEKLADLTGLCSEDLERYASLSLQERFYIAVLGLNEARRQKRLILPVADGGVIDKLGFDLEQVIANFRMKVRTQGFLNVANEFFAQEVHMEIGGAIQLWMPLSRYIDGHGYVPDWVGVEETPILAANTVCEIPGVTNYPGISEDAPEYFIQVRTSKIRQAYLPLDIDPSARDLVISHA